MIQSSTYVIASQKFEGMHMQLLFRVSSFSSRICWYLIQSILLLIHTIFPVLLATTKSLLNPFLQLIITKMSFSANATSFHSCSLLKGDVDIDSWMTVWTSPYNFLGKISGMICYCLLPRLKESDWSPSWFCT